MSTSIDTALVLTDPQNDFSAIEASRGNLSGAACRRTARSSTSRGCCRARRWAGRRCSCHLTTSTPRITGGSSAAPSSRRCTRSACSTARTPCLSKGSPGSVADWLDQYKPYLGDGETVIASPHKVYGPQNNDLVLQLRKRRIHRVLLAGMSANLCVESHLRHLLEQGFEVSVVADATAAAQHPELGDGYAAALTNFRYIASDVLSTDDAAKELSR